MKKITSVFFALFGFGIIIPQLALSQAPAWTKLIQMSTYGNQNVNAVTSDSIYRYMAVGISGPITFDATNFNSVGLRDLLIVKINTSGVCSWKKQLNAQTNGLIYAVAIKSDSLGNLFVAGNLSGSVTIGSTTITSDSTKNSFLAKFDSNGNGLWATAFSNISSGISDLVIDKNNNIFLESKSSKLIKFDNSGSILWEQTFPNGTIQAIAISGSNLYLAAVIKAGTTVFGSISLTSLGGTNNGVILKADLDGNYLNSLLVKGSVTSQGSTISDIKVDKTGNLYITGGFTKDLELGTNIITNPSAAYFTYVAKCNSNFEFAWVNSSTSFVNTAPGMFAFRVFVDNSNNVYQYGTNSNSITYGSVTSNQNSGQFLFKFDASGNATNSFELQNTSLDITKVSTTGKVLKAGTYTSIGDPNYMNFFIMQSNNNLTQEWQQMSTNSKSGIATILSVKYDNLGNSYLKSRVTGYCDYFGNIINTNYYLTVISKHDVSGNLLWMKTIRDINPDRFGTTFTLDKDKNVYTLGLFPASMNIDSINLTTTNSGLEAYLVKYSTTGNLLWAVPFNLGHDITISINLATDQLGNVIVTGVKDPENFLVKFDPLGNKLWTKYFPMQSYYFSLVATDSDNNIYLSSEIHLDNATGTTTIGSVTLNQAVTDGSIALIKFTENGDALWAKTYGGVANATYTDGWPCAIKVDASGNTYMWGWSRNNASFGNIILTNPIANQYYSYFLSKIDNTGNVVWAKGVYETSQGFNYGDLLDIDNNGNVYVGGDIRSKVSIDGNEFSPMSLADFFIAKFSSSGTFSWLKSVPAYSNTFGALSVYKEDVLSIVGAPYLNYTLDNLAVNQTGGTNFVMLTMGDISTINRETKISDLTVYPNPVVDKLFFNGITSNATVIITDLNGKTLISEQIVNNQIDINKLIKGIYIVQVSDKNGISTRKITKF